MQGRKTLDDAVEELEKELSDNGIPADVHAVGEPVVEKLNAEIGNTLVCRKSY